MLFISVMGGSWLLMRLQWSRADGSRGCIARTQAIVRVGSQTPVDHWSLLFLVRILRAYSRAHSKGSTGAREKSDPS